MRIFLSLLVTVLPATALAQPSPSTDVTTMATGDCARARRAGKTCVLSIDDGDLVEGTAPTAGETGILGMDFGRAASLIRVRRDFIPEILRAAEDLD